MTEATTITDDEIQEFIEGSEPPKYHTILQVWREVLRPAADEAKKRITPQWANRIVTSYTGVSFGDMADFKDLYFGKIMELDQVLLAEIEADDECLNAATPEEDVEQNTFHYINVLTDWQKTFLSWELDWDCTHPDAALELAAIAEVHKMFFEQTGLVALLDQIKFEFTDADREQLAAELEDLRTSREG
jgi:hypothetical protein